MCYVDFLDQILVSSSVGKYFMDNRLFYSYELGTLSLLVNVCFDTNSFLFSRSLYLKKILVSITTDLT